MSNSKLRPPSASNCKVTFPAEHVMLVTIARPKQMNTVTYAMNWEMDSLFAWFDEEPSLRVAVITGEGEKAFCAGSDLIEIEHMQKAKIGSKDAGKWTGAEMSSYVHPAGGEGGMSRRRGKKPILAAVNGLALGGGFEMALNADIVVASPEAQFGLPEPMVGVYAWSGGLPRLVRAVGMQTASDIALTGRRVSAQEALSLRLITAISKTHQSVLEETLEKAKQIAEISPDGIIVTRAGLREAWETSSVERAFQIVHENLYEKLLKSENSVEGLAAFREKRKPQWRESKL